MNKTDFEKLLNDFTDIIYETDEYEGVYINFYYDEPTKPVLVFDDSSWEEKIEQLLEVEFNVKLSDLESEGYLYTTHGCDIYHCDCCGLLICNDYYGIPRHFWNTTEGIYCASCVKEKMQEDYLLSLINNNKMANTLLTEGQLEEYGYKKLNTEFMYGLHNLEEIEYKPINVLKTLKNHGYDNVIFSIEDKNVFEVTYSVFVKVEEKEE